MKKYYLLFIACSFLLSNAFSQSLDDKRNEYEVEKTKIEELEKKAQYSGDDEIVRARSNLPPKLPKFEDWIKSKNFDQTSPITKEAPITESIAPKNSEQKNDTPPFKDEKKIEANSVESNQSSIFKNIPTLIGYGVGSFLYILSFLIYVQVPRLRKFSISTPFDLGCKNELSESEQSVKTKKVWIEFGLLLLSIIIYSMIFDSSLTALHAFITSLQAFLVSFLIVIVGRFLAGWATKCPKCKSTFASKCTNSHREPKGSYEKVNNGSSGGRPVEFVKVMETGVDHADYLCTVCGHVWHKASQYTRQISEHKRG